MDIQICYLSPEERKYTYKQSKRLAELSGCIGHLRAHFGSGDEFYPVWEDCVAQLKTPDFKRELDPVINTLRFGPIYIDKADYIIQEGDILRFDDGTSHEIFVLEEGSMGFKKSNADTYCPLDAPYTAPGLRSVQNAVITSLDNPDARMNKSHIGAILENRERLADFCRDTAKESEYGNGREWGIRVNTPDYAYLMRLNPNMGVYNLYCFCYQRELLDEHIQNARRGIQFVHVDGDDWFHLSDGDRILMVSDAGRSERTVRHVDDHHFEIGGPILSICYTALEFAIQAEGKSEEIIPLRSSLPEKCYLYVEATDTIALITRGERGYMETDVVPETVSKRKGVEYLNDTMGITKAQEAAMEAGAMFGWDKPAADPDTYDENGIARSDNTDGAPLEILGQASVVFASTESVNALLSEWAKTELEPGATACIVPSGKDKRIVQVEIITSEAINTQILKAAIERYAFLGDAEVEKTEACVYSLAASTATPFLADILQQKLGKKIKAVAFAEPLPQFGVKEAGDSIVAYF